jgi:pimeloyl-ACP methyl ester carboxylesterase
VSRSALVILCAVALAWPAAASAFTKTDEVVTMPDGVTVATTLHLPDGTPPQAGWPAVMMLHGLNGRRQDLHALAESTFVAQGYAVLSFDARGHGESGGVVTLDGPAEIADVRALFERLAARPEVDDARIGGWGVSYGGGAILRAAVDGVPFAALVPHITWSDLYGALLPQNFAKSGVVFGFVQGMQHPSELVTRLKDDAIASRNLGELRRVADERSSLRDLARVRTPTFWLQGKRDFVFGMEQAIDAYRRLAGPKRLYLGNLGHAPSTFVSDDSSYFLEQGRVWFDRFLKGMPNGVDTRLPVELAPTPFMANRIGRYRLLPATTNRQVTIFTWPRGQRIAAGGKVVRDVRVPLGAFETFGSATVTVSASTTSSWPHLVAVLSARTATGQETVISAGGVKTASLRSAARTLRIRLLSTSVPVPRGSKLRITLAATSQAQSSNNLLYLQSAPAGSTIAIRQISLTLPVLRNQVSIR